MPSIEREHPRRQRAPAGHAQLDRREAHRHAGTALGKVVQPAKLKAELKIPETQAKDVAVGQKAAIDTRNGIVDGARGRASIRPSRTAP